MLAAYQSDYPAARALFEESLAIVRKLGDRWTMGVVLNNLGNVACEQRDFVYASALHHEGLLIRRELGDRLGIVYALEGLAAMVAVLGGLTCARLFGAADRLRKELGTPPPPNELSLYEQRVAAARESWGDDPAFDQAWQEGRALTLEQAMELALAEAVERR